MTTKADCFDCVEVIDPEDTECDLEGYTLIRRQRRWIDQCGGTLSGYIRNYGRADDPDRHGDGGRAIYEADTAHLRSLELALARVRGDA